MSKGEFGPVWHEQELNKVDDEIARLAFLCDLRILDPGVIERVVRGEESVCGRRNDKAFKQLRGLVAMHYSLTQDSIANIGLDESREILDRIRERLGKRYDIGGSG